MTVTDINGCAVSTSETVGNIPPGTPTGILVQDVSCFGGNDGQASVSMAGGTLLSLTFGMILITKLLSSLRGFLLAVMMFQ